MKRAFELMLSLAVIVGGATVASAQDAPPPPPPGFGGGGQRMMQFQMPTFAELDKNKDKEAQQGRDASSVSASDVRPRGHKQRRLDR